MSEQQVTPSMRRVLEAVKAGYDAQIEYRRAMGGVGFAVLGGLALERGWVRTVRRRNGTRPYTLTPAGRSVLQSGTATEDA